MPAVSVLPAPVVPQSTDAALLERLARGDRSVLDELFRRYRLVAYRIAEREAPARARQAFAPWAGLCILLWLAAVALLSQPMEMRATFLGG